MYRALRRDTARWATIAAASESAARRLGQGTGAPGTLLLSLCGRLQHLCANAKGRGSGPGFSDKVPGRGASAASESGKERSGPRPRTAVSGIPDSVGWTASHSASESGASQETDTADYTTQQRNQPGADDQRTKLVPDRVGDVLSLCSEQESPATAGRVDSTQAALRTAQTKKARQVYRRLSAKSRRSRMERLDSGVIGERLVAESRRSTGPSSDEYRLVQGSRSREPL